MTTIQVWRNESGCIIRIRAEGHSGYAEEGHDIVCAAVSVLMTTCVNALESVACCKPLVRVKNHSGMMDVLLPDNCGERAQTVAETVLQGLRDISEAYPKQVQIK